MERHPADKPDDPARDGPEQDGEGALKVAFHLALRARGVRDLAVLRAMEQVPRAAFLDERHAALAARDLPVPIGGGQTASPAWLVAQMIEALGVERGHRVLQVGAGCGYATAVLRRIGAAVTASERVRGLALGANARLAAAGIGDVEVRWADGAAEGEGDFDRILVHAFCRDAPAALLRRLAAAGALVCAGPVESGQAIRRIELAEGGWREVSFQRCQLAPLREGLSRLD